MPVTPIAPIAHPFVPPPTGIQGHRGSEALLLTSQLSAPSVPTTASTGAPGVLTSRTAAEAIARSGLAESPQPTVGNLTLPRFTPAYDDSKVNERLVRGGKLRLGVTAMEFQRDARKISDGFIGVLTQTIRDTTVSVSDDFKASWKALFELIETEKLCVTDPEKRLWEKVRQILLTENFGNVDEDGMGGASLGDLLHDKVKGFWDFYIREYNKTISEWGSASEEGTKNQLLLLAGCILAAMVSSAKFPSKYLQSVIDAAVKLGVKAKDITIGDIKMNIATYVLVRACHSHPDMPEKIKSALIKSHNESGIEPQIPEGNM